jgi:hypothetical protein
MGSAQSTLTPETVLTAAVVVGGAVAIGYSTLAPGSSSSSGSGAESKAKKSKRKSTAAAGITVKSCFISSDFPPTASRTPLLLLFTVFSDLTVIGYQLAR